ncbi:Ig-like domain-containing protein [Rhodothermus marinus]|uniref:Ig-like domain-containing protein n=1 Tax=Rhodothermus marinus TaxID=29549 RepID=UPI0006D1C59D|nr:Ig-like domain-containing protein [Rhodothermus marinus]
MKRLMLLLTLTLAAAAQAQDLEVVSTTPAHGSASVDLTTAVSITFNKAISPTDSLFILPLDTLLQQQLTDPSRVTFSPDSTTITFNVTHQPIATTPGLCIMPRELMGAGWPGGTCFTTRPRLQQVPIPSVASS